MTGIVSIAIQTIMVIHFMVPSGCAFKVLHKFCYHINFCEDFAFRGAKLFDDDKWPCEVSNYSSSWAISQRVCRKAMSP